MWGFRGSLVEGPAFGVAALDSSLVWWASGFTIGSRNPIPDQIQETRLGEN